MIVPVFVGEGRYACNWPLSNLGGARMMRYAATIAGLITLVSPISASAQETFAFMSGNDVLTLCDLGITEDD